MGEVDENYAGVTKQGALPVIRHAHVTNPLRRGGEGAKHDVLIATVGSHDRIEGCAKWA